MYKIIGADQKEYGPVSLEQMRQWIAEGRVNALTLVQAAGTIGWKPLSEFSEFAASSLGPTPPPPGMIPLSPAPFAPFPTTNGMAVAGLVFGILSLTLSWICCFGTIFNVLGIVFSAVGLSQTNRNPQQKGKGMAIAGLVLSLIGIAAYVLFILVLGLSGWRGGLSDFRWPH